MINKADVRLACKKKLDELEDATYDLQNTYEGYRDLQIIQEAFKKDVLIQKIRNAFAESFEHIIRNHLKNDMNISDGILDDTTDYIRGCEIVDPDYITTLFDEMSQDLWMMQQDYKQKLEVILEEEINEDK